MVRALVQVISCWFYEFEPNVIFNIEQAWIKAWPNDTGLWGEIMLFCLFAKIDKERWSRWMPLPINGMKVKMVVNNDNEGYETRVDSRFPQSGNQHFGRWDQRQLFPAKLRWKKTTKKFTSKLNWQVDVTASKGEVSQSWSRWSWPRSSRARR